MKNIKHLLNIHAARLAVLLAVLAPAALVKGQVYPPPTVLPVFTNGDFETGDFTGWSLSGDTCGTYVVLNSARHGYQAHSGIFEAILGNCGDPDSSGYLSQRMSTGYGGYVCGLSISFWVNNIHGDPNANLSVSCDGTTFFGPQNLATTSGWVNIQTNTFFVGMNGSSVLQFGFNDPDGVFALDDISLQWTDVPVHGWFSYTTNNDGTFNLTGCSGCGGALIIPAWINLTNVTSIGNNAFQNYTSLTSVTFAGNGLTNITIITTNVTMNSSRVTTIGNNAFRNCTSMTNVTIGNSVTNIGQDAFLSCISLTSVTIGNSVTSIGGGAFWECTSLPSVVIPNSVINIGNVAFSSCISLTNVTIGNSVKNIGYEAFLNCPSLTSVTIPGSVTNIADEAFSGCASLTSVYFQGNAPLPTNDSSVFANDNNVTVYYMNGTTGWGATFDGRPTALLTVPNWSYSNNNGAIIITGYTGTGGTVTIPSTIGGLPVTSIGMNAFYFNNYLYSVTIPGSITNIGPGAFIGCTNLTSVTLSNGVTTIGYNAFMYCARLTSITIPNSVTSIGGNAFTLCTSLSSVTLGTGITNIIDFTFYDCSNLTSVVIPTGVTSIGNGAFYGCSSLASITIPASVTTIMSQAFENCTRLTSITIPAGVAFIADNTFNGCSSLASVTIPASVTSIGNGAFYGCGSLSGISLPASVTSILSQAFQNCPGLTGVYFQGNAPTPNADSTVFTDDPATVYYLPGTTGWNAPTFDGRPAVLLNPPFLCTTANGAITIIGYTGSGGAVTIPGTINSLPVTAIGSGAFQNCANLTTVTIPASVTNIADTAFQKCSSLAGVYFLGNPPSLGGSSVFLNDNNATAYNAAGTTGWGLTFGGLTMVLANNTSINGTNHYAYGANLGWLDWRSDTNHGAVIGTNVCSGYIYSANFGWISLGSGSPTNGVHYQNLSASDFGVNVDGSGNLNGYAYGANLGWITFTNIGAPQVDLASGNLSGSVWSANWGWISLSNAVASVQTAALQQGPPTRPQLTSISVNGTTLTIQAVNGTASGQYVLLGTTNVALPLSQWTPILTNSFSSGGTLNLSTNIINPAAPQQFYILKQ